MDPIVECVPNFSEGRRLGVVSDIADALDGVRHVFLLDQHSDPDHNRSVFTIAGQPERVGEAILAGARVACELIDLNHHSGEHPRVGALDVVPFVPLGGFPMEACAAIARTAAACIAEELEIPVYLYEAAARRPERRRLERIRRLGFERLRTEVEFREDLRPDLGPARLHPTAGATFVGARGPLVAFNINLENTDAGVARRIASAIRESDGGLPGVKALGLYMGTKGVAQVSINLTNPEATSLGMVFEAVEKEAERLGARIQKSELIGLAPRVAFREADPSRLRLEGFNPGMILENRISELGL